MDRNHLLALRELLITQMNYWDFLPLIATGMALVVTNTDGVSALSWGWWAALSPVPFGLYFVRVKCKKAVPFLLLHCIPAVLAFLIPVQHTAYRFLLVVMMMGFTIYSICLRLMTEDRQDAGINPIFAVGLAALCAFLRGHIGYTRWDALCTSALIGTLGLYFISSWLERYLQFLLVNQGSASHMPEREMFRSGLGLAVSSTLIGMAVLLVTAHIRWLGTIVQVFWTFLRGILVWLLSLIPLESLGGEKLVEETQEAAQAGAETLAATGETFWLWTALEYAAAIVILAGFVWAAAIGMRRLIRFIRENWCGRRRFRMTSGETSDETDVHERIETFRPDRMGEERKGLFERLSPRERIRRMYRKQAEKLENAQRRTARECGAALEMPGMASVYERARYSVHECTADDVKRMKTACRRN